MGALLAFSLIFQYGTSGSTTDDCSCAGCCRQEPTLQIPTAHAPVISTGSVVHVDQPLDAPSRSTEEVEFAPRASSPAEDHQRVHPDGRQWIRRKPDRGVRVLWNKPYLSRLYEAFAWSTNYSGMARVTRE